MADPHGSGLVAADVLNEEEFIARARRFLSEVGGKDASDLDPDANLVDSGVLDSLLLIAFLAFVEEQRGYEMDIQESDIKLLASLRTAYTLARPAARSAARPGHDAASGGREAAHREPAATPREPDTASGERGD
jgi:acyl carrier protein